MPGTECDGGKDCGREIGKMEALREEAGWRDKGQGMESLGTEARGGIAWNGGERETDILFTTIKSLVEYEKILHQIAIYTLNSVKFKHILEFLC